MNGTSNKEGASLPVTLIKIDLGLEDIPEAVRIICGHEAPKTLLVLTTPYKSRRGRRSLAQGKVPGWRCEPCDIEQPDLKASIAFSNAALEVAIRARDRQARKMLESGISAGHTLQARIRSGLLNS